MTQGVELQSLLVAACRITPACNEITAVDSYMYAGVSNGSLRDVLLSQGRPSDVKVSGKHCFRLAGVSAVCGDLCGVLASGLQSH